MIEKRHVLVTTDEARRGVFAGVLEVWNCDTAQIALTDARMCVYWSKDTRGVLGLASHGPADGSRVSPAVPRIELNGVTSVVDMTAKAVLAWEREPWS